MQTATCRVAIAAPIAPIGCPGSALLGCTHVRKAPPGAAPAGMCRQVCAVGVQGQQGTAWQVVLPLSAHAAGSVSAAPLRRLLLTLPCLSDRVLPMPAHNARFVLLGCGAGSAASAHTYCQVCFFRVQGRRCCPHRHELQGLCCCFAHRAVGAARPVCRC